MELPTNTTYTENFGAMTLKNKSVDWQKNRKEGRGMELTTKKDHASRRQNRQNSMGDTLARWTCRDGDHMVIQVIPLPLPNTTTATIVVSVVRSASVSFRFPLHFHLTVVLQYHTSRFRFPSLIRSLSFFTPFRRTSLTCHILGGRNRQRLACV